MAGGLAGCPHPVDTFFRAHRGHGRIALSTGGTTTGVGRTIVRTTASWADSFPAYSRLSGIGPGSRVWIPGPWTATMNLFAAVHARWAGAELVPDLASADAAVLTPHQLARACETDQPLAGVRVVSAGDRLARALHQRVVARGAEVGHYYGAAELSFVAWGHHEEDLEPFPGVEVEVRAGILWVRSRFLCESAADEPLPRDARGFATVGDRGRLLGDLVVVEGRGDDAVTTGGATVPVAEVEAFLQGRAAGDVVVVGFPHQELGEVVAAVLTREEDLALLRSSARRCLAPAQRPRRWFALAQLPLTPAGKLDRRALVDRLVSADPAVRVLT